MANRTYKDMSRAEWKEHTDRFRRNYEKHIVEQVLKEHLVSAEPIPDLEELPGQSPGKNKRNRPTFSR